MTRSLKSLPRLTRICQALRDAALADLKRASRAQAETQSMLDQLSQTPPAEDLGLVQAAQATLAYQSWASSRRRELNLVLARQTVAVEQARATAGLALGRVESLAEVTRRSKA